jgi:hypothetical protein
VAVVRQHVRKLDADAASSSVCHAPSVVHPLKWEDVCPWRSFLNLAGGTDAEVTLLSGGRRRRPLRPSLVFWLWATAFVLAVGLILVAVVARI